MILFEEETAPYRKTPLPPAYRVAGATGSMARDKTSTSARPVAVQVVPLLTEWKTPLSVPAYRVVGTLGLMTREVTYPEAPAKPVFSAVQWPPLSVERKTSSLVLAYRVPGVTGSMAREKTP